MTEEQNNREKFINLREKYKVFYFEDFKYEIIDEGFCMQFFFLCGNEKFSPKHTIFKKNFLNFRLNKSILDSLVFNIGLIELISYWKFACARNVVIKCGQLSDKQIRFWKKLYYNGLGEFFYLNNIEVDEKDFMHINCESTKVYHKEKLELNDEYIVPIGGGKDSVVSLELLRGKGKNITPMVINQRGATKECIRVAGFAPNETIETFRTIDKHLLELNSQGFLNGHTPFSAMLAFTTLLIAAFSNKKYIALSNENSANEATVIGTGINHQYSKSLEFEDDFRKYYKEFICDDIEYFSLLRPISELHIAKLFSSLAYKNVFRSCNVGSKEDKWCGHCPKCLFAFIILSPFVEPRSLEEIFGKNLFADESLMTYLQELDGEKDVKPFECVGTVSEVNYALFLRCKKFAVNDNDVLLKHWQQSHKTEIPSNTHTLLTSIDKNNNLPKDLKNIFEEEFSTLKKAEFSRYIKDEKICIMGFSREGQSTYRLIRSLLPNKKLIIYDANKAALYDNKMLLKDNNIMLYYDNMMEYDSSIMENEEENIFKKINDSCSLIFLTPAIALKNIPEIDAKKITNQCDIFLRLFHSQVIGISGTKGKSTTSSLCYKIIKREHENAILAGNIGIAFFDVMDDIKEDTIIVLELSCHQLQHIKRAPHISILLNLYEEHLDHYVSFEDYQLSKLNLLTKGTEEDYFIYNADDKRINSWIERFSLKRNYKEFSIGKYTYNEPKLKGEHNKLNILAALIACSIYNTRQQISEKELNIALNFEGLEHRLQFIRRVNDVDYYNDSISTIPEATLAALESIGNVSTLILGGMDRGIDYNRIVEVVSIYKVRHIAFVGQAGKRMYDVIMEYEHKTLLSSNDNKAKERDAKFTMQSHMLSNDWNEIVDFCFKSAEKHTSVLLSPAASSYDQFKNFEYRGRKFSELVLALQTNDVL